MGSVAKDTGDAIGGLWNDVSGKTQREAKKKSDKTQKQLGKMATAIGQQGAASTGAASDYWNTWLNDPAAAYQKTLGQATDIGGSLAGQATNNAVNAARASGLNAGQAALAGGAQTAGAFNQGTLGAQNALIGNQQTSAAGQSNQGLNQQANATGTLGNLAGLQQENYQKQQNRGDNMAGQVVGTLGNVIAVPATGGASLATPTTTPTT